MTASALSLSQAQEQYLKTLGEIRLCTAPRSLPLDAIIGGEHVGMNAEFMAIFQKKLPVAIRLIETQTWQQSMEFIQSDQCDIISMVAETPQRKEFLYFTDTYVSIPFVVVTTQEKFFISKLTMLADKPLGVIKGYAYVELLRSRYPDMNLVEVDSREQGLKMVDSGELYGFFSGLHLAGYAIQEGGYTSLKINGQFDELSTIRLGIGIHKSKQPLLAIFNELISELTPEQKSRIENSWRKIKFDISENYRITVFVLIASALLLLGFMALQLQTRRHNKQLAQKEKERWQQAHYDFLTELPNRRLLLDRLEQMIMNHQRTQKQFAVILIDLDGFKEVNDTMGHDIGDQLLVIAANRLKQCLRQSDTIARIGGDEFVALTSNFDQEESIDAILNKILTAFRSPFVLEETPLYVSASIGVTLYPQDIYEGETALTLMKNADQAMYSAKQQGKNTFHFFTHEMQQKALKRMEMLTDLRSALANNEFELYYQPIIDLQTRTIKKAEALLRWHCPKRGLVGPDEFIPVLEESRLINEVGQWVFESAVALIRELESNAYQPLQMSINVSPIQLRTQSLRHWRDTLTQHPSLKGTITIEITESMLLEKDIANDLIKMQNAGFLLALDDFGVGYSSLSYLRTFPIDFLKIDRSFVNDLVPSSNELALCKAIIEMAKQLNIEVIAEGVEVEQQESLLQSIDCQFAQGYYYAKPAPKDEFLKLLKTPHLQ